MTEYRRSDERHRRETNWSNLVFVVAILVILGLGLLRLLFG